MAENLSFEQTDQWGRTNEASEKKVKDVEDIAHRLESERLREDVSEIKRLNNSKPQKKKEGKTCTYKHRPGQRCPGTSGTCHDCHKEGHYKGAQVCEGKKDASKTGDKSTNQKKIKRKKQRQTVNKVSSGSSSEDNSSSNSVGRVVEIVVSCSDREKTEATVKIDVSIRPFNGGNKHLVH